jgi:hypothetical protein
VNKRGRLLLTAVVVLIAGGVFVVCLLSREKDPYYECRKRIKVGMTEEEATKVLDEYEFGSPGVGSSHTAFLLSFQRQGDDRVITLKVRKSDSIVEDVELYEVSNSTKDSFLQRIRKLLQ